ncbi:MAG: hypothetical protein ACI4UJ_03095 [Candidatus Cryptobacteroides sp.]
MESLDITTIGLCRSLEPFITGIDDVERFIGKDFVFHDAEVDCVSIDRDGTVKVRLWTWSEVDNDKYYYADFTLTGCVAVNAVNYDPSVCYVYELRFEVNSLNPDIITIILDGVGLEFSCRKIEIKVSECQE